MSESPSACYLEYGVSGYAVAFKLFHSDPIRSEELKEMSRDLMIQIADNCVKKGAKYIGHIKSYLETKEGSIKADTIGVKYGAEVEGKISRPVRCVDLTVNSIVQGIDKGQVRDATLEAAHKIIKVYGFEIEIEREHSFFDRFDFSSRDEGG